MKWYDGHTPKTHKNNEIILFRMKIKTVVQYSFMKIICVYIYILLTIPFYDYISLVFIVNKWNTLTLRVYHLTCYDDCFGCPEPDCMRAADSYPQIVNYQIYDYDCCGDTINSIQFTDTAYTAHTRTRTDIKIHDQRNCKEQTLMCGCAFACFTKISLCMKYNFDRK